METSSVDSVEFLRVLLTPRDPRGMSRPLRLEFEGAFWHITSRGNERKDIFREDRDQLLFLSLLATAVKRFRWRLHEYCLMTNHYHLVLETPFRTLAKGMHWLNSEYVRIFNKRYKRVGHLFQGRYKSVLVDEQNYLDEVRRYTVLNPVRADMVAGRPNTAGRVIGRTPVSIPFRSGFTPSGCSTCILTRRSATGKSGAREKWGQASASRASNRDSTCCIEMAQGV